MASVLFRTLFTNSVVLHKSSVSNVRNISTAAAMYAARKGTRAKAKAKKVKVEVTKVGFIPHNQRGKNRAITVKVNKHLDDMYKPLPKDDVYPMKYFRWNMYTPEDAVRAHQETHHKTMYNVPDALVIAHIEVNMEGIKKNRYLDSFQRLSLLPHLFPRDEERSILVFCKGAEHIKAAIDAGGTMVGSTELVKKIQEGEIKLSDFDSVLAHPNIITDLVPIRGLMKRRFPNLRAGTLDPNLELMVKKFASGVQYKVVKDELQEDFGSVDVPVGRLNMNPNLVGENIVALLKDLQSVRPKRDGLFITRCLIKSPPSGERLKIDPFEYIDRTLSKEVQEESDDETEAAVAANA